MTTSRSDFKADTFYAHWSKYLAFVANSHIKHATKAVKSKKPIYFLDDSAVLDCLKQSSDLILKAARLIAEAAPHAICPKCNGAMCRDCRMSGWIPKPKLKVRRKRKRGMMWADTTR